jgi:chemotaxis protein CheD
MPPPGDDLPRVHVAAAEVCIARKPVLIETVLGSCVSAVVWSRRLKVGGICHGALPQCPSGMLRDRGPKPCLRYVDFAIKYLVQEVAAMGATREELEVKLFGGADVLPILAPGPSGSVGSQNCSMALRTLEEENVRLMKSDLGGVQGRVIYFNTETGDVFLRRLQAAEVLAEDPDEFALEC